MRWRWLFTTLLAAACVAPPHVAAQTPPPQKVSVVTVTGCLTQGPGDTWLLTNATEPIPAPRRPAATSAPAASTATATAATTTAATTTTTTTTTTTKAPPVSGKNQFKLIGILELNVPSHKGHTVTVRGLLIPASPERRINLTSIQMVSDTCSAPAGNTPTKRP
jgi:hypothetical protein